MPPPGFLPGTDAMPTMLSAGFKMSEMPASWTSLFWKSVTA